MKLLIVSQYFWPENFRINELAADMAARGHHVTVLTGQPNYPSGKFFAGYGWGKRRHETYRGVTIVRAPLLPRGSASALRLALNYLSFVITGTIGALFTLRGPFDAIFVFEVSPVTVGIPAIVASKRFGAPIAFWVLDLWPESLKAAGGVHSPFILGAVNQLVKWIYRRCSRVLAASRAFIPEIALQGVAESNIVYFPNWGESVFKPLAKPDLSVIPKLPDGFKVLFSGNIGESQDFASLLKAAQILRDRADIQWIIVGDGRMAAWAKEEAKKQRLHMHFLGQHPLESMPHFYAAADALLLSLKPERIFALTVPGKLQSYMACARPVLAMLDGEGARIAEESGGGLACPAGDAERLAANVLKLAAMPQEALREMGRKAQSYFERNFDRNSLFNLLENLLKDIHQERRSR